MLFNHDLLLKHIINGIEESLTAIDLINHRGNTDDELLTVGLIRLNLLSLLTKLKNLATVNTSEMTKEDYIENIPDNCELDTFEKHQDILYCWGLINSILNGYKLDCGICEFNKNNKQKNE